MIRRVDMRTQVLMNMPGIGGNTVLLYRGDRFHTKGEGQVMDVDIGEFRSKGVGKVLQVIEWKSLTSLVGLNCLIGLTSLIRLLPASGHHYECRQEYWRGQQA